MTLMDAVSRVRMALDGSSELELFARYPNLARQSDTLAVRMRTGDRDAVNEFVLFHQKLAQKASRMLVRWVGLDADDALQIAMMGVIEAAKRFDPTKDTNSRRMRVTGSGSSASVTLPITAC